MPKRPSIRVGRRNAKTDDLPPKKPRFVIRKEERGGICGPMLILLIAVVLTFYCCVIR